MPLFGKSTKPFIDESRGDPEAAALRQAAASGNWQPVETALANTTDQGRREFLVEAISAHTRNIGWVDRWVRERPALPAARAVWGACAVQYAFQIRTGAAPEKVSDHQWRGFAEWLGQALQQLRHATQVDGNDSAPWVALLWAAVGVGGEPDEVAEVWEAAQHRNPRTELGALAYTTFISPRWHGTAEQMWAFVHGLLADEPDGGPRWMLIPTAHLENWVAQSMEASTKLQARGYFRRPDVQQEIIDAYSRYLGSPARRTSPLEPQARETFAGAFYLMGSRDELRRELEHVGPGIQEIPWAYFGSPLTAYQKVRESVGLK